MACHRPTLTAAGVADTIETSCAAVVSHTGVREVDNRRCLRETDAVSATRAININTNSNMSLSFIAQTSCAVQESDV